MQQSQDPPMADQNLVADVQTSTVAPQPQNANVQAPTPLPQSHSQGQTTTVTALDSTGAIDNRAIAAGEIPRSSRWPAVEIAHLQSHPTCAACGQGQPGSGLQVHHMLPFHFCVKLGRPELELDERNLMTLCDETINNHHLLLGHLGDFQSYNPNVKADVVGPLGKLGDDQIDTNPSWQAEMRQRPPFLSHMNSEQIAAFKVLMDTWYPPQPGSGNN